MVGFRLSLLLWLTVSLFGSNSFSSEHHWVVLSSCNSESPRFQSHHGLGLTPEQYGELYTNQDFRALNEIRFQWRPECLPDTLYMWAWSDEISKTLEPIYEHLEKNHRRWLEWYTWRTPLGSYGYGNTLIRIKLKPEAEFSFVDGFYNLGCNIRERNFVYVRVGHNTTRPSLRRETPPPTGGFMWAEFDLCSTELIESISVLQSETLHEMDLEREWMRKYRNHSATLYFYEKFFDENHQLDTEKFRVRWGPRHMQRVFERAEERSNTQTHPPNFFYLGEKPSATIEQLQLRLEEHFRTEKPTYFNTD